MLLENIQLPENLPFTLNFSNVAEENYHYHNEMEILLILRGTSKCKIHNVLYELKKGDVLIIDTQDMHRIFDSSKDVLMLDIYVNLGYFEDLYPDIEYMIFACEDYSKASSLKHQDLQKKVSVLKHLIAKTALSYFNEPENHELLLASVDDLIFNLVNQFQGFFIEDYKFKADESTPGDVDLVRLYKIIKYIYLNYDEKITLDDLSRMLHLSPYYVSHLIKNTSGLSFQNFLNYVRLEYGEKMLVENRLNLTEISTACGFSSLSYFNKCFKIWHNMTPSQYKKQLPSGERRFHGEFSGEEAMNLLKEYLIASQMSDKEKLLSQYSHHIFIPVKKSFKKGQPFRQSFPLNITLSDKDDILMLTRHREKIRALKPDALLLDCGNLFGDKDVNEVSGMLNSLMSTDFNFLIYNEGKGKNDPLNNLLEVSGISSVHSLPAMQSKSLLIEGNSDKSWEEGRSAFKAFSSIVTLPKKAIALAGNSRALFTLQGLATPYYHVYLILSEINGIITERRDQYMIIKDEDNIFLLIYQADNETKLKAHVRISELKGKHIVIEKLYEKKHSALEISEVLSGHFLLSKGGMSLAEQFTQGSTNIIEANVSDGLDLNYDLNPDSFLFVRVTN